jgi:hypothetical protein
LRENEFNFCRCWHYRTLNIDNKFHVLYNKYLHDDYFLNRTVINKKLHIELNNKNEVKKIMEPLIHFSKQRKIPLYLHLNSDQTVLEEYLLYNNFNKIDEVIGLYYNYNNYPDFPIVNVNNGSSEQSVQFLQILLVKNVATLKKWIKTYCSSFNIDKSKGRFIYQILRKRLNTFKLVFAAMNVGGDDDGQMIGCGLLFSYHNCIALYCLGTLGEYRHKNVATTIMNFSTNLFRKKGYQIFGLQTLKSDNLLPFYLKKGYVMCYNNNVYEICNR